MKKIMFLKIFVMVIATAHGQLMSVDGQETHTAKNPNIYEIKQSSEYSSLVCDASPLKAPNLMYHDHCDAACYASNVKVSAKVGLTRFAQQMNLINSTESGRLSTGTFDANNPASVQMMKKIINKYGRIYDIDLQGIVYQLLGVVNDFSGKSGWIARSDIKVANFLVLDLSSIPGCSANSIYVIAKADCLNNADDNLTLAVHNGKAIIVGGMGQNPNPQGNGNQSAGNGSNDPGFQKALEFAKSQSTTGQPIIVVYNGGNSATVTPASGNVGTCGCPNPNQAMTITPAPVVIQQAPPFQQTVVQQPVVQQQNDPYAASNNAYLRRTANATTASAVENGLALVLGAVTGGMTVRRLGRGYQGGGGGYRGGYNGGYTNNHVVYPGGNSSGGPANWPNGPGSSGTTTLSGGGPANWRNGN